MIFCNKQINKQINNLWAFVKSLRSFQECVNEDITEEHNFLRNRVDGLEIAFDNLVEYLKLDYNDDGVFKKRKKKK
jgi:hypothetical protein